MALSAELDKKEKMIKELINDKLKFSSIDGNPLLEKSTSSVDKLKEIRSKCLNFFLNKDTKTIEKLEAEVRGLKKKNEELSKLGGAGGVQNRTFFKIYINIYILIFML